MQLLNHEKNHAILRLYHLLHDSVKRVHFVVNVIVAEERKEKNDGREHFYEGEETDFLSKTTLNMMRTAGGILEENSL